MLRVCPFATMIGIGVCLATSSGCVSGERRDHARPEARSNAQPAAAPAAQEPAKPAAQTTTASNDEKAKREAEEKAKKDAQEKAKKEAKEARERERKLVKLQRELDVARMRLAKLKLDHDQGELKRQETFERTRVELDILKERFRIHREIGVPNRVARAELNMKWAESGLLEARQELEQLELMYSEEQFADKTKEIVIDRARRSLERTQRDFELRTEEHKTLLELTIPMETRDMELGVQDKERVLVNMDRDEASAKIERQIALINAQAEIDRLEYEIADLQEEIKEAAEKKAEEQATQTGPGPAAKP